MEALHAGSDLLKSMLHTNNAVGDSNYISRPTGQTQKLAVSIRDTGVIQLHVLPDAFSFAETLTADAVDAIEAGHGGSVSVMMVS